MTWNEKIARQLNDALIRLEVLCQVYAPPRGPHQASDDLKGQNHHLPMPATTRGPGGIQ